MRLGRIDVSSRLVVIALTVVGAGLRLYDLGGRSLWTDEILNTQATQQASLGQVLAINPLDHLPLDIVVSWFFRFLGTDDATIRLPFAVAGVLLVPAVYLLGRRLFDTPTGLVAALLVAISPFATWYSQEASPYSLLMLLVTLQAWCALRAADLARIQDWLLLALVTALSLYTHYAGALAALAVFSWLLVELVIQARSAGRSAEKSAVRFMGLAIAALLSLLAIAPLLPTIHAFLLVGAGQDAARFAAGAQPVADLATLLQGLAIGWFALAFALVGAWQARHRPRVLLLFSLVVPVLAWAVVLRGGILVLLPRYLAESWPAFVLLTSAGVMATARAVDSRGLAKSPIVALGLSVLLVAEAAPTLVAWYGEPKDDWRGAARLIAAQSGTGSAVLTMGAGSDWAAPAVRWYLDGFRAPRLVVDAGGSSSDNRSTTDGTVRQLLSSSGPAFAVLANTRGPADLRSGGRSQNGPLTPLPAVPPGFQRTDLVGATVIRAPDLPNLLAWGATFVPGVLATEGLADPSLAGRRLFPPEDGPFQVTASGGASQDTWSEPVGEAKALVVRFACDSTGADGRVYLSAHDVKGGWLALFPSNAGYPCTGGSGGFAFATPPGTVKVTLWLRVTGRGSATFSGVRVVEIEPPA